LAEAAALAEAEALAAALAAALAEEAQALAEAFAEEQADGEIKLIIEETNNVPEELQRARLRESQQIRARAAYIIEMQRRRQSNKRFGLRF